MLRVWVLAAFVVPLAGCSTGPDPAEEPLPLTPATTSPARALPIPQTDTLHFLDEPHMAASLPRDGAVVRTRIPSDTNLLTGTLDIPTWRLPPLDLSQLRATVRLVVDVQGVVTPYGYSTFGGATACFWNVAVMVEGNDPTMYDHVTHLCLREGPVVPTGVRVLEMALPEAMLMSVQGQPLVIVVWASSIESPDATVDLLSGTADADSTLTIERLQVPLETLTLTH